MPHGQSKGMTACLVLVIFYGAAITAQLQNSIHRSFFKDVHSHLGFQNVNWMLPHSIDFDYTHFPLKMKKPVLFLQNTQEEYSKLEMNYSETTLTFVFPDVAPPVQPIKGPFLAPISWKRNQVIGHNLRLTSSGM